MKLLSIVIPAYNVEKYLDEAMAPYLKLKNPERIEVLIVNDGSKDGTLSLAKKYENEYPDFIKVIDKENGGHGSTINAGIREATGKYFKVVDGDDWVDTKALEHLLEIMEQSNSDMIATGFVIVCQDVDQKEVIHIENVDYGKEYHFKDICAQIDYIRMHSTIFRTEILQKNHVELDEHCFYVDVEHDLYPLRWIDTITFYDELLYRYRIGRPGQSVSMKGMVKNRENHERVLRHVLKMVDEYAFPETVKEYIMKKLEVMVSLQYSTLFYLGVNSAAKKELMAFDHWLKNANQRLYRSVPQKKIWLLRMSGFRGYYMVQFIYQLIGKKEEYVK